MTLAEIRILEKRGALTIRPGRPKIPSILALTNRRRLHRAVGIALRVFRRHRSVKSIEKELGTSRQYVLQELRFGIAYLEETGWLREKRP